MCINIYTEIDDIMPLSTDYLSLLGVAVVHKHTLTSDNWKGHPNVIEKGRIYIS